MNILFVISLCEVVTSSSCPYYLYVFFYSISNDGTSLGEYQPDYQCAEFVSRSLAAGGYIPGLHGNESQSRFLNYHHNGKTYDLLWVSHKQGGPLGLEDLLIVLGWK
jgi:hypothetical protein